jgi:hypothetical protein
MMPVNRYTLASTSTVYRMHYFVSVCDKQWVQPKMLHAKFCGKDNILSYDHFKLSSEVDFVGLAKRHASESLKDVMPPPLCSMVVIQCRSWQGVSYRFATVGPHAARTYFERPYLDVPSPDKFVDDRVVRNPGSFLLYIMHNGRNQRARPCRRTKDQSNVQIEQLPNIGQHTGCSRRMQILQTRGRIAWLVHLVHVRIGSGNVILDKLQPSKSQGELTACKSKITSILLKLLHSSRFLLAAGCAVRYLDLFPYLCWRPYLQQDCNVYNLQKLRAGGCRWKGQESKLQGCQHDHSHGYRIDPPPYQKWNAGNIPRIELIVKCSAEGNADEVSHKHSIADIVRRQSRGMGFGPLCIGNFDPLNAEECQASQMAREQDNGHCLGDKDVFWQKLT